ncbi:MAG TPA: PKD domain-containing protein, partial [Gaiellaceae bacterium]|nr:PKD domain-containing protein [Gaiellaceae bacterium]
SHGEATPPQGTFSQVSAGSSRSCAIRSDGALVCWGSDALGQEISSTRRFTQVSAGGIAVCAVERDQSLACWGGYAFAESAPPANRAPVSLPGGPYVASEGASVSLALGGTDPDGDALTYSWDLGDGTTGSGATPPTSHVYADDGVYTIQLAVADGRGGTDSRTTTVTVANVAPSISADGGVTGPSAAIPLVDRSATATIEVRFSDPAGQHDTYAARIDCGNGSILTASAVASPYTAHCPYSAAGVYTVSASISDEDGGTSAVASYQYVIVYDPAGAFTVGSGWFTSPSTACPALCSSDARRAEFAFRASFRNGRAAAPEGAVTFRVQPAQRTVSASGALEFRSTSIEMLVVSGRRVQLWGTGAVNGVSGYAFRITAVDGGAGGAADAVRVEIWDRERTRVYDSQWDAPGDAAPATPVEGGQISILRPWNRWLGRASG